MFEQYQKRPNEQYLLKEYLETGRSPVILTMADRSFVVPYGYVNRFRSSDEAIMEFKKDLFDFQEQETKKYQDRHEIPVKLSIDNATYVVPASWHGRFNQELLVKKVLDQAEVKYHAVINAHRKLAKMNLIETSVVMSSRALDQYTTLLNEHSIYAGLGADFAVKQKVLQFLETQGDKYLPKFKITADKVRKKLAKAVLENEVRLAKKIRFKYLKFAFLTTTLGLVGTSLVNTVIRNENKEEVSVKDNTSVKVGSYVYKDFLGNYHTDLYGNLQRIKDLRADIMALIVAIEGYSEEAFLEGNKNPTIGTGFTVHIEEDGQRKMVKMGDVTNPQQDAEYNVRYIEKEFIPVLGDKVGRSLSDEEILTCIGAGYCWGTKGLKKSKFFQSIKDKEPLEEQMRKLSGFRTPLGLLKRSYLLSQVLSSSWSSADLLDMPIYKIVDETKNIHAFLDCAIYTKDYDAYMPCDKVFNIKKGKLCAQPIISSDDFCVGFYKDRSQKMLSELIKQAKTSGRLYKRVRDFLPEDMVKSIENETSYFDKDAHKMFKMILREQRRKML